MIFFPLTQLLRLSKSLVNCFLPAVQNILGSCCAKLVIMFGNWYIFTCFVLPFKIEEEEQQLEAAIEETEKQCAEVTAELKELELKSARFKELEEK